MFRFALFLAASVLVATADQASRGYLSYNSESENVLGSHIVTDACQVLDLEGEIFHSYTVKYNALDATNSGCAQLWGGAQGGRCSGTPTKSLNIGDSVTFSESDGHYWGVKYSASC